MRSTELLQQLESCYNAIYPATINSEHAFAWFTDIPHPLFNAIMHVTGKALHEKLDTLIKETPAGHPLSVWVHPQNSASGLVDLLRERSFAIAMSCPLMGWTVTPLCDQKCDIRSAKTEMEAFIQIISTVFHLDEITREKYGNLLSRAQVENYLLFIENMPIGTGTLFLNGKTGGIFNIAIAPEHQKKGYARAMMEFLMHKAHQYNLEKIVLLSSPEAESLYLNLGFKKSHDIDIYVR